MTSLSFIIPTFNRADSLAQTLTGLSQVDIPADVEAEVLVVDNNSSDDTDAVVSAHAAAGTCPVRRVNESVQGLCHARNRGLAEARHTHVCYLDDDVNVASDWVLSYVTAIDQHGADAVVGPVTPVFDTNLPACLSDRVVDSLSSSYSLHGTGVVRLPREKAHLLPGCNFGVRRATALDMGGFDTRFDRSGKGLLAGGDTEFGLRLAKADCAVVYHPGCAVQHRIGQGKLEPAYLRRRWYGLGVTQRMLARLEGRAPSVAALCGGYAGVLRLAMLGVLYAAAGQRAQAMEYRLRALRATGYWWGGSASLLVTQDERRSGK